MQRFVVKANVDHFIGLLNGSDLPPDKRKDNTKLLIAELDKLAHDLEHLERKVIGGRETGWSVRSKADRAGGRDMRRGMEAAQRKVRES